jgi:hypothetical protein
MFKKFVLSALIFGCSQLAQAGIIYQLEDASQTGAPGTTLAFFVTLTNTSSTDQVWLNGTGSTSSSAFLSIDTNPFFTNAPFFLDPLQVSAKFEAFDVTIDPSAPAGAYIGSIFSIQGGPDAGAGTAFDDLADISFDVNVQTVSAVPEPGTFGGAFIGLSAVGWWAAKRQSRGGPTT